MAQFTRRHFIGTTLLAPVLTGMDSTAGKRIPVIFDTDIGGDMDDTWALYYLLRCPQLDLRLVATDHTSTSYRARLTAKLLETAGRSDIAVSLGPDRADWDGPQQAWVGDYQLTDYAGPIIDDGAEAMIAMIEASDEPVTVISVGPAPVLANALQRRPDIAGKARLVGMFGSVRVGYGDDPEPVAEYNVREDPAALRTMLAAPWQDILLAPIDTCGLILLDGEDYARVWQSTDPLARAIIENYRTWLPNAAWMPEGYDLTAKSSTLFDILAVELAYDESSVVIESLPISVTDEGMTVIDPENGKTVRCAMSWRDLAGLEAKIATLLTNGG